MKSHCLKKIRTYLYRDGRDKGSKNFSTLKHPTPRIFTSWQRFHTKLQEFEGEDEYYFHCPSPKSLFLYLSLCKFDLSMKIIRQFFRLLVFHHWRMQGYWIGRPTPPPLFHKNGFKLTSETKLRNLKWLDNGR